VHDADRGVTGVTQSLLMIKRPPLSRKPDDDDLPTAA
jgi:hypothetical protein